MKQAGYLAIYFAKGNSARNFCADSRDGTVLSADVANAVAQDARDSERNNYGT